MGNAPVNKPSLFRSLLAGALTGLGAGMAAGEHPEQIGPLFAQARQRQENQRMQREQFAAHQQNEQKRLGMEQQRVGIEQQQANQQGRMVDPQIKLAEAQTEFSNINKLKIAKEIEQMPEKQKQEWTAIQSAYITALSHVGAKIRFVSPDSFEAISGVAEEYNGAKNLIPVHDPANNKILWLEKPDAILRYPKDEPDIVLPSGRHIPLANQSVELSEHRLASESAIEAAKMAAQFPKFSSSPEDIDETAKAIFEGRAVPVLSNYSFRDRTAIAARLSRANYNQAEAERDWKAVQKHLASLNSPQQLRLRQATSFASGSLDLVEKAYQEWKQTGLPGGFRTWNKAALLIAKQSPGQAGAKAQVLDGLINDLVAELAVVYRGGNASTDEAMKLAAANLGAAWNEETLKNSLGMLRKTLTIRSNSIKTSEPMGVSEQSPYPPKQAGQTPPPGATVKVPGSDGKLHWSDGKQDLGVVQ